MRVRPAARTGNGVDALDPFRAHAKQPIVSNRHQLVLARAGSDRATDIYIRRIDHRRRQLQQLDLIRGLDLTRVEHRLLAIHYLDADRFQRAQHRQFHDVDADRLIGDAAIDQRLLDLLREVILDLQPWRQAALHGGYRRGDVVGDPG